TDKEGSKQLTAGNMASLSVLMLPSASCTFHLLTLSESSPRSQCHFQKYVKVQGLTRRSPMVPQHVVDGVCVCVCVVCVCVGVCVCVFSDGRMEYPEHSDPDGEEEKVQAPKGGVSTSDRSVLMEDSVCQRE